MFCSDERWKLLIEQILFDVRLNAIPYQDILSQISTFCVDSSIPAGSKVLVRADLDVPLDASKTRVLDNERLESLRSTLDTCKNLGLTPVLFGHVGRNKENTAAPIAAEIEKLFGARCVFIPDWLDEKTGEVPAAARDAILASSPTDIVLLEQTRRYELERVLWGKSKEDIVSIDLIAYNAARSVSQHIASYYVFDALASHNPDWSSVIIPGAMKKSYIGDYTYRELVGPLQAIQGAEIVILGGLKIDKLDALEGIVKRGATRLVLCGGSIAMALVKASGRSIGRAEDAKFSGEKWFIGADHVRQAKRILSVAKANEIDMVLPKDFLLDDGVISDEIPEGRAQMDIGPASVDLFTSKIAKFLETQRRATVFCNGSVGAFEIEKFAGGTRAITGFLSTAKQKFRGVEIYVGGGDGRLAFKMFGEVTAISHVFTCGGTVLKVIGSGSLNYLKSIYVYSDEALRH